MSSARYAAVPREEVPLQNVSLESGDVNAASSADADAGGDDASSSGTTPARKHLTKRTLYSSHRIEEHTPRLAGETDDAFRRRVNSAHMGALMHSVVWVLLAGAVLFYTDLFTVVRYDTRVNQLFLALAGASGGVLLMVVAYLALWVPLTAPRPVVDLTSYAPLAGPIGAASGVATFVFLCVAFWPIWGIVTLPILIVLSFAACLGPNLIPF